jgi:hypothetical protein
MPQCATEVYPESWIYWNLARVTTKKEHSTCPVWFVIPSISTNSVPTIPVAWETDLIGNPMYNTRRKSGSIRIFTWLACVVAFPPQLRHHDAIDSHVLPLATRNIFFLYQFLHRSPHCSWKILDTHTPQQTPSKCAHAQVPMAMPPLWGLTNIALWRTISPPFWKSGVTIIWVLGGISCGRDWHLRLGLCCRTYVLTELSCLMLWRSLL